MLLSRTFSFILSISIIIVLSSGQSDYCGICPNHTMCLHRNSKPVCNATVASLTPEEQNEIVNVHNKFRQRVASGKETKGNPGPQPPAKKMPKLIWNKEIATIAQRWANQCKFDHDKCRNIERFPVGQNLALASASGMAPLSLKELIALWYNEVELFDSREVERYVFDEKTGHYTQMLWAKTTEIGCGYVRYHDSGTIYDETVYLVCNYGPAGNYIGEKIYEVRR